MLTTRSVPSPYGLGWARRLAVLNAPADISVRESFDRQLLVGFLASSSGFFVMSGVLMAPFISTGEALMGLIPALGSLVLMLVFLARGGRVVPYSHVALTLGYPAPLVGGIVYEGALGWVQLAWCLPYPLTAALLTGTRGGGVWTLITFATIGLAVIAKTWPGMVPTMDAAPAMSAPLSLGFGLAAVSAFQMLAVTWFIQQREIVEGLLAQERKAVEDLLLNVLPAPVAERLRRGEVVADQVDEVTVVFADLVGFTTLAANLPARRVVELLADVFGAIDRIADEEGIEKVKTIGDCYMAVSGAPTATRDHADRALRFACRVRDRLEGWSHHGTVLRVRIGVHSGPAMAGVLGEKRMLYDLWGDTVNAASRLESSSEPGKVHASEATLRLATERWEVEERGEVSLKGRAAMRTVFVRGKASSEAPALRIVG